MVLSHPVEYKQLKFTENVTYRSIENRAHIADLNLNTDYHMLVEIGSNMVISPPGRGELVESRGFSVTMSRIPPPPSMHCFPPTA